MDKAGIPSQSALARRSGVPQPTINRILKGVGRQGPATETLKKLAAACEAPFQWLADGTGAGSSPGAGGDAVDAVPAPDIDLLFVEVKPPRAHQAAGPVCIRKVRLRPSARHTDMAVSRVDEAGDAIYLGREWLERRGYDGPMLIALSMTGDSMEPGLCAGDTLIVNTMDRAPSDGAVFVFAYEETVLIRRLLRDAGSWWLCSDSVAQQRFPRKRYLIESCHMIGRVVYRLSERV